MPRNRFLRPALAIALLLSLSLTVMGARAGTGTAKGSTYPAAQAATTEIEASLVVTLTCSGTCDAQPLYWGDGTSILIPPGTSNKIYKHLYKYSGLYKIALLATAATVEVTTTKQDKNSHRMRVQLQEGTQNSYSPSPIVSQFPIRKEQVRVKLEELFYGSKTAKWFPWVDAEKSFRSAVVHMSEWMNGISNPICSIGTIHQEYFNARGRTFRIDLENNAGCNLGK